MGCCLSRSTITAAAPPSSSSAKPTLQPKPHAETRNNPPPAVEEETVKEVLTETPFPVIDQKLNERIYAEAVLEKKTKVNERVDGLVKQQQEERKVDAFEIQSEEASEITVATQSRSVAAAVSVSVSENGGGEEAISKSRDGGRKRERAEVVVKRNQRSVDRSPAKVSRRRPYSGESTVGGRREKRVRSPAKRVVPSPEKKTHSPAPRTVRGRSQSPATSNNRNVVNSGATRIRRDSGEPSGRMSRSPARPAFPNSSNRVGPVSEVNDGQRQRQREEACITNRAEDADDGCAAAESLDNPLVSMECFIFL